MLQHVRTFLARRGDAAPSTSTDKSKAASDELRPAHQEASLASQALQRSAAPSQMPFAFQHSTPGVQVPAPEQLTPVLPDRQQLTPVEGVPADAPMHLGDGPHSLPATAGPTLLQLTTSAAEGLHRAAQAAQHSGPGVMQSSQLPVTPSMQPDGRIQETLQPENAIHRQTWGEGLSVVRGKPGSNSKHSRSSSEDQRGSRLGADLPTPILRSATAPPQLLLESQRGSNSPKKPLPKCTAQPGANLEDRNSYRHPQRQSPFLQDA